MLYSCLQSGQQKWPLWRHFVSQVMSVAAVSLKLNFLAHARAEQLEEEYHDDSMLNLLFFGALEKSHFGTAVS